MDLIKIKEILDRASIHYSENLVIIKKQDNPEVYKIESGKNNLVFKIFSDRSQSLAAEKFYDFAGKNGISVSKLILMKETWILIAWLDGELVKNLDKSHQYESGIKVGEELHKMHKILMSGFGWPIDAKNFISKYSDFNFNFFINKINDFIRDGCDPYLRDEMNKIFGNESLREILSFKGPVLLHGDLASTNIIVDKKGKCWFFDPGEIISGDPMMDLGYSQTSQNSFEFRKGVWEGYVSEKKLSSEEEIRFKKWKLLLQCYIAYRAMFLNGKRAAEHVSFAEELIKNF
ncbi:MAG TPA: hypothetical protein DIT25_00440 [Candidatus Moranbacteria bacterium]|nr:hypothetical protein [Candidatus Moranbacteria bacterium]